MAQIIPRSNFLAESLEKSLGPLGGGISQGISTGLQSLANLKLQQMSQRQQAAQTQQALQGLPGMTPELSQSIAGLPQPLQQAYLHEYLAAPREMEYAKSIQGIMSQLSGQPAAQSALETQPAQPQVQVPAEQVAGPYTPYNVQQLPQQPQMMAQPQIPQLPGRLTSQQATQLAQMAMGMQNLALKQQTLAEKKEARQESQLTRSYEQQKDYMEKAEVAAKDLKEHQSTIKKLKVLNASGKLIQGPGRALLEKMGAEKFFLNPTTENAQLLMGSLMKSTVRGVGVARNTNKLLTIEQAMTPSLLNTQKGLATALENADLNDAAEKEYHDARREVYDKYIKSGKPLPHNFQALVNQKAEPKVSKIYDKQISNYVDIMKDTLPKGREGDEGYLPGQPGLLWRFEKGKWNPLTTEEQA